MICPDCNGNGYIGGSRDADLQKDCKKCKNQGEIEITEESINALLDQVESARMQ